MSFERIPSPDKPESGSNDKSKPYRFTRKGREFMMTPEEKKAHEEAEKRRKILEEKQKAEEIIESLKSPEEPH